MMHLFKELGTNPHEAQHAPRAAAGRIATKSPSCGSHAENPECVHGGATAPGITFERTTSVQKPIGTATHMAAPWDTDKTAFFFYNNAQWQGGKDVDNLVSKLAPLRA